MEGLVQGDELVGVAVCVLKLGRPEPAATLPLKGDGVVRVGCWNDGAAEDLVDPPPNGVGAFDDSGGNMEVFAGIGALA